MVEYDMAHPEFFLFIDELETNFDSREEGQIGGEKLVNTTNAQHAHIVSNSNSERFTTLGFISGDGKPVMCVVILKSKSLSHAEKIGLDIDTTHVSLEDDLLSNIEINSGKGKMYPGDSIYTCFDKEVPYLVTYLENSSVNSDILI